MGALRGCRAVKCDSCNSLRSFLHTRLVIMPVGSCEFENNKPRGLLLWRSCLMQSQVLITSTPRRPAHEPEHWALYLLFQLPCLTFKALNANAPFYLQALLTRYIPPRFLRSKATPGRPDYSPALYQIKSQYPDVSVLYCIVCIH